MQRMYNKSTEASRKNSLQVPLLLVAVVLLVLSIVLIYRLVGTQTVVEQPLEGIAELWDGGEYSRILELLEPVLETEPLHMEYLLLYGFSAYYEGMSQVSQDDRLDYINRSITSLRLIMQDVDDVRLSELYYILAKAYYQKGHFYCDLVIDYMQKSVDLGYLGSDSYEYLGLAYTNLELYEESLPYYLKAAENESSPLWSLTIGRTYYNIREYVSAEQYLSEAVNRTEDMEIEQSARMMLADIYYEKNEYSKAKEEYLAVIENNPDNIDAHFYLGELYFEEGDIVQARREWRVTERLNPQHYGALTRLYN